MLIVTLFGTARGSGEAVRVSERVPVAFAVTLAVAVLLPELSTVAVAVREKDREMDIVGEKVREGVAAGDAEGEVALGRGEDVVDAVDDGAMVVVGAADGEAEATKIWPTKPVWLPASTLVGAPYQHWPGVHVPPGMQKLQAVQPGEAQQAAAQAYWFVAVLL